MAARKTANSKFDCPLKFVVQILTCWLTTLNLCSIHFPLYMDWTALQECNTFREATAHPSKLEVYSGHVTRSLVTSQLDYYRMLFVGAGFGKCSEPWC